MFIFEAPIAMKKKKPAQAAVAETIKPHTDQGFNLPVETTWSLLLFIFSTLLYANTIGHGYALDDVAVIQQNKFVQQGLAGIPQILTTFYWQGFWDLNAGLYRPLSLVMFALEQTLFPNSPFINHFVNVLLFACSTVLLFKTILKLFGKNYGTMAAVASLLFAAHPIHTEVVANIKSRDELLALFTLLATCIYLLKYLEHNNKLHLAFAVFAYALALFSKESSVAFLGLFVLVFFYKKTAVKQSLFALAPFLIVAGIFFAIHQYVIANGPPRVGYTYRDNSILASVSFAERFATALYMQGKYLLLLLFPHPLSYDYSFQQIPLFNLTSWQVLLSAVGIIGLITAGIKGLLSRTVIGFGIAWYAITMFITSNLIIPIGATMAERFVFIPSLGLCLAAAYLLVKYLAKASEKLSAPTAMLKQAALLSGVLVLVLALYSFKTISRNADWKDSQTLFVADINNAPNSYNVQYNYGTVYIEAAKQEQDAKRKQELLTTATSAFERAIKIDSGVAAAHINLASAYYQLGNYTQAYKAETKALTIDTLSVDLYNNAGNYAYRLKLYNEGLGYLQQAVARGLANEETYKFIGGTYFAQQNIPAALEAYDKAIAINPRHIENLTNAANIYAMTGNYAKAASLTKQALAIEPQNRNLQSTLLRIYVDTKQQDSLQYYSQMFGVR